MDFEYTSAAELFKSPTYKKYMDEYGQCTKCFENAGLLRPCCSASIVYQGDVINPEVLWEIINEELKHETK